MHVFFVDLALSRFYAWYSKLNQAVGTLSCIFGKIERQYIFPKEKLEILTLYSRACTTCLKAKNTADRNSGCMYAFYARFTEEIKWTLLGPFLYPNSEVNTLEVFDEKNAANSGI